MRYFLGYSDKFNSSHLLFLLALITSVFCLNTHARSLFRECTAGHVRLVLTAPLCFSPRHLVTRTSIDSTPAFTHALPAGPKIRREMQRDKYAQLIYRVASATPKLEMPSACVPRQIYGFRSFRARTEEFIVRYIFLTSQNIGYSCPI